MILYCVEHCDSSGYDRQVDRYWWFSTKSEALVHFYEQGHDYDWNAYLYAQENFPEDPFITLWRVELPKQSPKKMLVEAMKVVTWPSWYGKAILSYHCNVDKENETLKKFIKGGE
tara:strand:+ start:4797 stop:5141 length:345 start_codon:yes stop_codon:yes gene_type:complete